MAECRSGGGGPLASLSGMRIGFAGTPAFAAAALQSIADAGATVPLVLTQPDRAAGRGMKLQASAVKGLAHKLGLNLVQPRSLRLDGKYPDDAQAARLSLQAAKLDALVVAAYGLILPEWVLATPRLGCLNIHGSILPRWRGAAPIHRAIEAGDAQTGITIMQMDAGLDTGDVLAIERIAIEADDTTERLHERLSAMGARMVVEVLHAAKTGQLQRTPQPREGPEICYAHKVDKAQANLDWSRPAEELARQVRAFNPNPGAWTTRQPSDASAQSEVWKIWECYVVDSNTINESVDQGRIIHQNGAEIAVLCGQGRLVLTQVQRAGGKRLSATDFVRGAAFGSGERVASR